MEMVRLRDEQGIVMLAALGMVAILAGISLAVASSGQQSLRMSGHNKLRYPTAFRAP